VTLNVVISAIGCAFSVLSNPVKRKRYDEFGPEDVSQVLPRQRRQRYSSGDEDDTFYGYTYGFEGRRFVSVFWRTGIASNE